MMPTEREIDIQNERYHGGVFTEVDKREDGWSFSIRETWTDPVDGKECKGNSCFGVAFDDWGDFPDPKVGQRIRVYGVASEVRGVDVDEEEVYFLNQAERERRHKKWCQDKEEKEKKEFEEKRIEIDLDFEVLPEVFRRRLEKFRRNKKNFRWANEPYEMFICKEAVKITEWLEFDKGRLEKFRDMDYKDQKAIIPDLDDGHSGNTFSVAMKLAYWYITKPENVVLEHAGSCPIGGCTKSGCRPEEEDGEE